MPKALKFAFLLPMLAFAFFIGMSAVFMPMMSSDAAHAGGGRPPILPPNPVTDAMRADETREYSAIYACIGKRVFDVRATGDLTRLDDANDSAAVAATNRDLPEFTKWAGVVHSEVERLKPKYCS